MNNSHEKLSIVQFNKAVAMVNIVRYTNDPIYVIQYVYDGEGYIDRLPIVKTKDGDFFDFSRTKHTNLGLVPVDWEYLNKGTDYGDDDAE